MSLKKKNQNRTLRRIQRVRLAVRKNNTLPRVSVFRSLNHIYAQIIDDNAHKTLVSCSSLELKQVSGEKKAVAHAVGVALAKLAQEKKIVAATFDRGGFLYHGRIKALADGLREGGLKI